MSGARAERLRQRLHAVRSPIAAAAVAQLTRRLATSSSDRGLTAAHRVIGWSPQRPASMVVDYDGVEFVVDLQDNLQRTLYYLGHYEAPVHDLLIRELRPGDVFADIGANIGVHALPLARRLKPSGGAVVAFEPAADTVAILRTLAARNGLELDIRDIALGRGAGTGILRRSPNWAAGDLGVRSLYGEGEAVGEVAIQSFDDWADQVQLERLDLVKIDVEGAEFDVLAGMSRTLEALRPRLIVVEVIDHFLQRSGSSAEELDAFLGDLGYLIDGPTVVEIGRGPTDGLWPNAVYRTRSG